MSRPAFVGLLAGVAALAGCEPARPSEQAPQAPSRSDPASPALKTVQTVQVLKPGKKPQPAAREVQVRVGESVVIRTTLAKGQQPPPGAKLRIKVPVGPDGALSPTVGSTGGRVSASTRLISRGRPIRLTELRFVCYIPPHTSCSVEQGRRTPEVYELVVPAPTKGRAIVFIVRASAP